MNYQERIASDYQIMLGKPVIKGARITVELLLRKLAEGATIPDLLAMYPNLQEADILASLNFVSNMLASEEVIMLNVA